MLFAEKRATEVTSVFGRLWQRDILITSYKVLKIIEGTLPPSLYTIEQQNTQEFLTVIWEWLREDLN